MGAWQSALRDGLGLPTEAVTGIGAATFIGSVLAMLGGRAFDALGPRAACALGGLMNTAGYGLIATALVCSESLPYVVKIALPTIGSAMAGYSSVSLLDNVVCMACSLSFPKDRAAVVGYLKAVLAAAAGLWALLWVHVFKDGPGLVAYVGTVAAVAFCGTMAALVGLRVLPEGVDRRKVHVHVHVACSMCIKPVCACRMCMRQQPACANSQHVQTACTSPTPASLTPRSCAV